MKSLPTQEQIKGQSTTDLCKLFETNSDRGLSSSEARLRSHQFGFNEIVQANKNPILIILKKFWGPSAWMIECIAGLSFFLHKNVDAEVALGLLFINAVIGFFQERRAQQVVSLLKSKLEIKSRTCRDGIWADMPARELVPGDIVRVRMGDFVPADLTILSGDISVDQSTLTGESDEKNKGAGDNVFSASLVRQGEMLGLITFTGSHTFYGRTVQLVQNAQPKLHMEEVVSKLVKKLFAIVGAVVAIVVIVGFVRGTPMVEILPLSLVLLMGAIPIALPVMFTVSTAVGARLLGKKGVLVTRLSATEDAATMQVLCVDKTGTLTLNELVVEGIYPDENVQLKDLLLCAALASNSSNRDPIDLAVLNYAKKFNSPVDRYKQIQFVPFSPKTRKTEATVEYEGSRFQVIKGALKAVAAACSLCSEKIQSLEASADELAKKGCRAIAVAKIHNQQTQFLGLVALNDPPRPDSAELIKRLHELGIKVKMLTGDALPVARQIAQEVGLGAIAKMDDIQVKNLKWLDEIDGIGAVFPEDKYNVIKALQDAKIVAGMTGDGVNDSPALQVAEVGIAVKGATDAARAAASVVLTESGLTGIVDLVENGRSVYQRILTWVINKVSRTTLKTGFVGLAYIFTGHLLISALGMLVLTFMTDFVKITLATDNVRASKAPDSWQIKPVTNIAVAIGLCMVVEALTLLFIGSRIARISWSSHEIHTFSFLILLFMALFSILCIRERGPFWKSRPSKPLTAALIADGVVGIAIGYWGIADLPALSASMIAIAFVGSALLSLGANDFLKIKLYRSF